jgi:hypothetical protein
MKKLKPVVFHSNTYQRHSQNTMQQMLLLKALAITDDPEQLKRMIGARTVADVYRTFDKLAIRKEYHQALSDNGISFDFLVKGIKEICRDSSSDSVRLKGYQTILRSLGMDKYEQEHGGGTDWEKLLVEAAERNEGVKKIEAPTGEVVKYDVKVPEIPEDIRKQQEEEREEAKSLYE